MCSVLHSQSEFHGFLSLSMLRYCVLSTEVSYSRFDLLALSCLHVHILFLLFFSSFLRNFPLLLPLSLFHFSLLLPLLIALLSPPIHSTLLPSLSTSPPLSHLCLCNCTVSRGNRSNRLLFPVSLCSLIISPEELVRSQTAS